MSRPLRLEFAGAFYHITSRGNGRKEVYLEESDFELSLELLNDVCEQYNWVIHAYRLMDNHYHLLLETPDGNLNKGIRPITLKIVMVFSSNR
jgi:putative transposase